MSDLMSKLNQGASQIKRQAAAFRSQAEELAKAARPGNATNGEAEAVAGAPNAAEYAYEAPLPGIAAPLPASGIPKPAGLASSEAARQAQENAHGERIAFIVDSCCDVLPSYREKYPVFVAPMLINYHDASFLDRETISPQEVFDRFSEEVPKTSTPTPAYVHRAFEQARAAGFTHLVCITISSGLSSTNSVFETVSRNFPELDCAIIDTLNIGAGAGAVAVYAMDLYEAGEPFARIVEKTREVVGRTRIYILPDTLEYLYKGGRISKAVYSLGSVLNLRPVITCAEDGTYAVIGKARGRKKSVAKLVELAQKGVDEPRNYRVFFANGMAEEEKDALIKAAVKDFPDAREVVDARELSPALVVHTGPGLLGLIVQNYGPED